MKAGVPRAVRTLADGLVDYAGLFPPASLDLEQAARNYAAYRRSRVAWMLGRLVLPACRLAEFTRVADPLLPHGEGVVPWRIAALLGPDIANDVSRVEAFNAAHADAGRALVDVVETRVTSAADVRRVASTVPRSLRLACEAPGPGVDDEFVAAIAGTGATLKLRTGGVVADAFPAPDALATVLWRSARRQVPLKATAGLHHATRGEHPVSADPDAPLVTMHGFVNLVMAAAWAYAHAGDTRGGDGIPASRGDDTGCDAPPTDLVALLEARDATGLHVAADGLSWGAHRVSEADLDRVRRRFGLAVGSCSFEDPVQELRALGWLHG